MLRGELGRLLAAVSAFELGNAAATLLILRATDLLTPSRGHDSAVKVALVLYAGYNLAATLASVPAGHATDRRGGIVVLLRGRPRLPRGLPRLRLHGLGDRRCSPCSSPPRESGSASPRPPSRAAVASLAPPDLRGSAFGALAAIQSFGNLAASAVAGGLWTLVSPRAAFLYLAGWMVVSAAALVAMAGRLRLSP